MQLERMTSWIMLSDRGYFRNDTRVFVDNSVDLVDFYRVLHRKMTWFTEKYLHELAKIDKE